MAKLVTAHSFNDYPKLKIAAYRKQLRQGDADSIKLSYSYRNKSYSYSIRLDKTAPHYGGYRYWWSCPKCSKPSAMIAATMSKAKLLGLDKGDSDHDADAQPVKIVIQTVDARNYDKDCL